MSRLGALIAFAVWVSAVVVVNSVIVAAGSSDVAAAGQVAFSVAADATPTAFPHYWEECVGSGHAALGLREDWQTQLAAAHQDLGVRRVRFHGVFDDDIGVVQGVDVATGQLQLNFTNLDTVYDAIARAGMRPYVELDFMPGALANGSVTYLHYKANVTPPRNLTQWAMLIRAFTSHVVDRYGHNSSTPWMFEVWNEPNLRNTLGPINLGEFWNGTQAEYFSLYATTSVAIKQVCPTCQVGGPASEAGGWLPEFVNYTAAGGYPVDFISTHGYPNQVGNGMEVDGMAMLVSAARAQVGMGVPLVYSEYNSGLYPFFVGNNDDPFASAFIVHTIPSLQPYNLSALSYWTFSDIFDEIMFDTVPFHDGYGLLTVQGIPKPAYRAFQLLHSLGTDRLPVTVLHSVPSNTTVSAWATRNATHLQLLLSNYQPLLPLHPPYSNWTVQVSVSGVVAGGGCITRIDATHSNPVAAWKAMGSPTTLSSAQLAALIAASQLRTQPMAGADGVRAVEHGKGATPEAVTVNLPRQGVAMLVWRLAARGQPTAAAGM